MDSEGKTHLNTNIKPRPSLKFANLEEKMKDLKENETKKTKPALRKRLSWNVENIEENEREKINNPRKKIDEPKTPYIYHEDGDSIYLNKLSEINKLQPTVITI